MLSRTSLFVPFLVLGCSLALPGSRLAAAPAPRVGKPSSATPLAPWVEANFPFFSSVVDARKAGTGFPEDNLTPRGIVLNLGRDVYACFDPDLLRVSALWKGKGVTPKALAPGSYVDFGKKTPGGQSPLPEPDGKVWVAAGIYPGWQAGESFSLKDPRTPTPTPSEVGRGPIAEALGRFDAIKLVGDGAILEYTVNGTRIREWWTVSDEAGQLTVARNFEVAPTPQPLRLVVGNKAADVGFSLLLGRDRAGSAELSEENGVWTVRVPARGTALRFGLVTGPASIAGKLSGLAREVPTGAPIRRWPQEVTTAMTLSKAKDAYVVDHVALPFDNPWRRGFRPSDVQFLANGTGVTVTLDGDVWLIDGLGATGGKSIRWRRFASGLHEPMTIAIREGQIYAFDKNAIWCLRDTNGDGEADTHELFSNGFGQTADMREFPSGIRLAPNGEFIIAKGGQQADTQGKHNGSVLRISADGHRATLLGYGFRQPNIGVNIRTGLVTSSDQQGQYIPSTPLHIVRDAQFYGFLAPFEPKEKYPAPPAEPLTWIPHAVNASATSQVWLFDARMGPLNDGMVHIGFNKPEVFRAVMNSRGTRPQAAVVSVTRAFEFPPLHGSVNPTDGQLYIAGFQVLGWGNVLDVLAGLGRVRYTGAPVTLPSEIVPMDQGVLLTFDVALDPKKAKDPASYSLQSWHYQRTYKYGSPQYKADGTPGQDYLTASAAYLSEDGRKVFIAVPGMKPVEQLRVGWSLATSAGVSFEENAYTTPYELARFNPKAEGFGAISVDLTPRAVVAQASTPISLEEGRRLSQLFACVACHSDEANPGIVKSGPPWRGLFGTERTVVVGGKSLKVEANEAYVRESILEPTAKIAAGFEKGEYAMPSYAGVLTGSQIDSLVLYIKSLR